MKVPGVVPIAGSGPHGRDELVTGHRPVLLSGDYLTRKGSAVLRYDKRGVGRSGGNYATAMTSVLPVMHKLRSRSCAHALRSILARSACSDAVREA